MTRAKITGMGAYAPKRILTNADLEKMVATSDEWIVQRSGIRERHIADDGEAWRVTTPPSDLPAVRTALEEAGIAVESSDLVMVAANLVPLDDAGAARSVLNLIDTLEDNDDVQAVHANFDIAEDVFAALEVG